MFGGVVGSNYRIWLAVDDGKGLPKTGLIPGNFTISVIALDDSAKVVASAVVSTQVAGVYYFDVSGVFLTTHGVGNYGVHVVIAAVAPKFDAVLGRQLTVNLNDIDMIRRSINPLYSSL
jgi:hypothetical protein